VVADRRVVASLLAPAHFIVINGINGNPVHTANFVIITPWIAVKTRMRQEPGYSPQN
jgi:hypothetical protein